VAGEGITVYCPCCGAKLVVPFTPAKGLRVAVSKRCTKCKKLFRIEVSGEYIFVRGGWKDI